MHRTVFALIFLFTSSISALSQDWKNSAIDELKTEKSIVETLFTGSSSLWVSMVDDGSSRDGFAQYVCLILIEKGMPSGDLVVISIWDAAEMARGNQKRIGRHECASG